MNRLHSTAIEEAAKTGATATADNGLFGGSSPPGPTTQSDANRRFLVSEQKPAICGVSAVQIPGVRSLPPPVVAWTFWLPVSGRANPFLAPETVVGRDRQDQIDKPSIVYWRDHSAGGRQTDDADAMGQSAFDGSLHEFGREEGKRDRYIDLSNAALVACSNLLNTGTGRMSHQANAGHARWRQRV